MTGALLLLACFCYPIDPATIPPPPRPLWASGHRGADVDPVLSEVRALREEVRACASREDVQACHDAIVELKAAVMGKNQLIDEDHATLTHPTTGVVVRQTKMESSQTRHSRLLWGVATAFSGICVTVSGAWVIKRLGLRNGKRT